MRKMISNLYKWKWGEEESNYKKEEENVTVKLRVVERQRDKKEGKMLEKM